MRFTNHTEWCEQLEPGDCVRSDNEIVEVARNATGYIIIANQPDEENRYREYDSLYALPADAFDYDKLCDQDADFIDGVNFEGPYCSLDAFQKVLRHKYSYELPPEVKPTANSSYHIQTMNMLHQPTLNLLEAVFSYPIVAAPEDGTLMNPTEAGTGFFLHYKDRHIFITVDHIIHDDYATGEKISHGFDNHAAILTGRIHRNSENRREGELFRLGGFYYFEKFNASDPDSVADLFDAAYIIFDDDRYKQLVSITSGAVKSDGQVIVPRGINRIPIAANIIATPNAEDTYFVAGQVKYHWQQNEAGDKILASSYIQHPEMRYHHTDGDFIILTNLESIIKSHWKGLSGSPVINQEGALLGILCDGKVGADKVYVMDIRKVIRMVDYSLQIEEINKQTK